LVASVAGAVFAPTLVGLFSTDDKVIEIGTLALRLQCVSFPLMAWTVMCTMLTQTMGRVVSASFLSLARQGLFFIPLVIGVPYLIAWAMHAVDPILGVQMAQPLSDIGTAAVSVPVCVHVMRKYLAKDEKIS
jgi:Na+-driven multidrug efflux pump